MSKSKILFRVTFYKPLIIFKSMVQLFRKCCSNKNTTFLKIAGNFDSLKSDLRSIIHKYSEKLTF